MERGHCRGAASTGMCLGVVPGPPAWGADRYADLSRHSGRSSTPRSSKHARGFWYSVSGTPTASNGRGKDGVDAGNADSGGLLDLGPAQAWPAGPVSLSPSSVPGIKRCWNTQPAKAQNHPPRPPCSVIPKPPVEEREEEAPPQHRRLRWLGEDFPPPKAAPSPGLTLLLPSVVLGPQTHQLPTPPTAWPRQGWGGPAQGRLRDAVPGRQLGTRSRSSLQGATLPSGPQSVPWSSGQHPAPRARHRHCPLPVEKPGPLAQRRPSTPGSPSKNPPTAG